MKNNIIILLIIWLLATTSTSMHAYRWIFNNFTNKLLLIQVELLDSSRVFLALAEPKKSCDFDWPPGNTMAGFCLGKIKYIVVDNQLLGSGGFKVLVNQQTKEVKDVDRLLNWLNNVATAADAKSNGLSKPYPRLEADLLLYEDEIFQQTVDAARQLVGTKLGAKIVQHFANLVKESKCRSRDIMVVEKDGKIEFYTLAN